MDLDKMTFTDRELLYYGTTRNFPEDPCDSLLIPVGDTSSPDALARLCESRPEILPVVDAVVAAAMAPRRTLRVFSGSEEGFLRLRMAQHITDEPQDPYAVLIRSGSDGNLLQILPPKEVLDILCELSLGAGGSEENPQFPVPLAFSISVLEQLAILGACDVINQNRYEGGWFTSVSVGNAFDRAELQSFSNLCAPLAEVADQLIYSAVGPEGFELALEAMVNSGMLIKRMVDGIPLYSFDETLKALPRQFKEARQRFASACIDKEGSFHLLYALAGEAGPWCFYANNTEGCLIRTGHKGLKRLLSEILMPGDTNQGQTVGSGQKKCAACGGPLDAGDQFCGSCGAAV